MTEVIRTKPMSAKRVLAIIKAAPRYSRFHIQYGTLGPKRFNDTKPYYFAQWLRYLNRDKARKVAAEQLVFAITHAVVKPSKQPDVETIAKFGGPLD